MIPAVSHPAVPPPTMTTALTGCVTLEFCTHSYRERAAIVHHVQGLVREPSTGVIDVVVEVERLEEHVEVVVDVVLAAEVHFSVGCEVGRLVGERTAVLLLTDLQQLLTLPLHRQTSLEPVVLIEGDEVCR